MKILCEGCVLVHRDGSIMIVGFEFDAEGASADMMQAQMIGLVEERVLFAANKIVERRVKIAADGMGKAALTLQ